MLPYLAISVLIMIFCSADLFRISRPLKIALYFLLYVTVTIFVGFRYKVGSDWDTYEEIYQTIELYDKLDFRIELGFLAINQLFVFLGLSFQALILAFGMVSLGLKFYSIQKYTDSFFIPILYYMSYFLIEYEMSGIRQSFAMGFGFLALWYVKQRKLGPFLLCIASGALFHISILAFIPVFFLNKFTFTFSGYLIMIGIGLLFTFTNLSNVLLNFLNFLPLGDYITGKVMSYSLTAPAPGFTFGHLPYLIFAVLFVYYKNLVNDSFYNILLNAFIVGVFLSFVFSGSIGALNRLTYYYLMVGGILLSYIFSNTGYVINKILLFIMLSLFIIIKSWDALRDPQVRKYYVPYTMKMK